MHSAKFWGGCGSHGTENGTRLILGSKTGEVQVWDTTSAKLIKSLIPVPVQQAAIAAR